MSHNTARLSLLLRIALLASILSLAIVYIAQLGFGLHPCHLCLWQRLPYAVVIILALLGLYAPRHRIWLLLIIGTAFAIGGAIASYHTAVEKHWVTGPTGCTSSSTPGESMEDFMKKIQEAPVALCDQPQWEFHGITMAMMNAVWSFILCIAIFSGLRQSCKNESINA